MKRNNDFAVGLTILAGIAILLTAIVWVKEAHVGRREAHVSARVGDVGRAIAEPITGCRH